MNIFPIVSQSLLVVLALLFTIHHLKSLTKSSNSHTSCAGQFVSRSFVVLLRKSIPQNYNLQSAVVHGVRLERKTMNDSIKNYKEFISRFSEIDLNYYSIEKEADKHSPNKDFAVALISKLSEDELEGINKILSNVFVCGVYQALEKLDEEISDENLKLIYKGQELPFEPFGEEICSDWASLSEGEDWPDEQFCPIHKNIKLKVEPVPIKYGLLRYSEGYFSERERNFPLANSYIEGGCLRGSEEFQNRAFCSECRKALGNWEASNNV